MAVAHCQIPCGIYGDATRIALLYEHVHGHTHHDHIVCQDCGRVEEFVDPLIEDRQKAIASEHGFDITSHSLIIYGRCMRENCPHLKRG